jgi:O-antigen ligase/tetratricopeptide (TPR) repeat protein
VAVVVIVACLVAPLVVGRDILFPYVVPRAVFMRGALGIGLAVLLGLVLTRRYRLLDPRDPILAAYSIFLLIAGLTGLLGVSPQRSLFGEMERMWGVVTWFYFLVLYALLRTLGRERWRSWLRISIGVGVLVASLAVLQRFEHVLPTGVTGAARGTVYSTLGNPSYLSIYMVFQIGFASLLLLGARTRVERMVLAGVLVLSGVAFTLGGGRSALIGMGAGVVVGAGVLWLAAKRQSHSHRTRRAAAYLLAGTVMIFALVLSPVGQSNPMVQRLMGLSFADTTFTVRFAAWKVAWQAFMDNPFLGLGYENFQVAFARYYPPHIDDIVGSSTWDRGHNLYLDLLGSTGIFGFMAYLAIWGAYFWSVRSAFRSGRASPWQTAILSGMGVAYLVYLVMWFEDHASTISLVVLFAYVSSVRSGGPLAVFAPSLERRRTGWAFAGLATAVIALFTWQHAIQVHQAARLTVAARSAETVEERLAVFGRALDASGSVGLVVVALYTDYLRSFTLSLPEIRPHPQQVRTLALAVDDGLRKVDRAIAIDPHNDVWWIDQSRLLALAAELTGSHQYHEASLRSLRQAIEISPTQPRLYHLLSELHLVTGDTDSALVVLCQALELPGGRGRTHYFMSRAHRAAGDTDRSREALLAALMAGEIERHALLVWHLEQLERRGADSAMVPLLRAYWSARKNTRTGRIDTATRQDFEIISRLPLAALRLGDAGQAIRAAEELRRDYPPAAMLIERFIRDVRAGRGRVWRPHQSLAMAATAFGGLKEAGRFQR